MKSIKHVKERVTEYENLYKAYLHARKCKRFRDEVLEFSANLEENLHGIQDGLRNMTYKPGPYLKRVIHDPVERLIMWQAFIHRVVQWAVYQVINPEFVQGYIEDSYACIKGRGSDAAAKRLFYYENIPTGGHSKAARPERQAIGENLYQAESVSVLGCQPRAWRRFK